MKNVSFAIAFFFFALFSTSSYAAINGPTPTDPIGLHQGQPANIFVHISSISNTPNGLTAQIDGFSVPQGKAGRNTLRARLSIQGKRLQIQLHPQGPKVAQLTMPAGYQLPKAIADQLGAGSSVVMSGGTTMVKQETKSMLWFEIQ